MHPFGYHPAVHWFCFTTQWGQLHRGTFCICHESAKMIKFNKNVCPRNILNVETLLSHYMATCIESHWSYWHKGNYWCCVGINSEEPWVPASPCWSVHLNDLPQAQNNGKSFKKCFQKYMCCWDFWLALLQGQLFICHLVLLCPSASKVWPIFYAKSQVLCF